MGRPPHLIYRPLVAIETLEQALEQALVGPKGKPAVPRTWRLLDAVRKVDWGREDVGEPQLRALLHVSRHWGNAGFDVLRLLAPDHAEMVEVKRGDPGRVLVYLSENERRRALDWERRKPGCWQLWIVGRHPRPHDATKAVLPVLEGKAGGHIEKVVKLGMQPEGWALAVVVK